MIDSTVGRTRVARRWPGVLLAMAAAAMPQASSFAEEPDNLDQIRNWLKQGVSFALFSQDQANIMLDALRRESQIAEALIQSQIMEGLNLAAAAKAAVAMTFYELQVAPDDIDGPAELSLAPAADCRRRGRAASPT